MSEADSKPAAAMQHQGLEKEADLAAGNLHGYLSLKPGFPF
jgi:hypothetical protein